MFAIPYGSRFLEMHIPQTNLLFDAGPRDVAPAADPDGVILDALAHPIGTPPLRSLVKSGQRVIVIGDDNTRLTPTGEIIPLLLDELNRAGIPDRDINLIIAQGTHRPMTCAEIMEKYGRPVLSRVAILPHSYKDPRNLMDYGTTRRGTRILVNRHVMEADVRIAVGNIIPHHPTGWSAGAKALLPGVAGEETVAQMHLLGARYPALGEVDTPMRQEMEDFAAKVGLTFILNVVLNRQGEIVHDVAGHFVAAHRAGVELSKQVYGVPIPALADMTISSTSPIDFDFFQADKGITAAEPATVPGGEIVLVSACHEGVSPAHPELADYVGKMTNTEIWALLRDQQIPDPLTAAEAIVINDIASKRRITVVTEGLSPELCQRMGFRHVWPNDLAAYIAEQLRKDPGLKVGVLRQSAEVVPLLSP